MVTGKIILPEKIITICPSSIILACFSTYTCLSESKNAPATFQSALDLIFSRQKWKCLLYMYDIIIFSKDVEEHIYYMDDILATLEEAVVTVNLRFTVNLKLFIPLANTSITLVILSSPDDYKSTNHTKNPHVLQTTT